MKTKYITILDQEVGEVFQYEVKIVNGVPFGYEDYIIEKGHNLNNIEWMVHDESTIKRMYYTN